MCTSTSLFVHSVHADVNFRILVSTTYRDLQFMGINFPTYSNFFSWLYFSTTVAMILATYEFEFGFWLKF